MVESPCISSFVIRIIKEQDPQLAASPIRGIIRHIQSDQELSFTNWDDVEGFIQRYVPLHQLDGSKEVACDELESQEVQGAKNAD
jgi:hypothetical protein